MVCAIIVPWDCLLRNFFYLYIPIGCLDLSLLLCVRMRETVVAGGRSLQRLYNGLHFCVTFLFRTASCLDRRTRTCRQHGGYLLCGQPFTWWLEFHVCLALIRLNVLYICNALQHFSIFYRIKGNRRTTRMRQSMHFDIRITQAFSEGTLLECLFQMVCFVSAQFLGL